MTNMPGMGVMIGMLSGNKETVDSWQSAKGKTIQDVALRNDKLHFRFSDGTGIVVFDDGQSCCEARYMQTDDELSHFVGATLLDAEIKNGPDEADEWGEVHETAFFEVKTSLGCFTVVTHNEHNGYYGGFWIVVEPENVA